MEIKWIIRKAKVRPCVYMRQNPKENQVELTYLPKRAYRFETKQEAIDYSRCLYENTGIAWEQVAIFLKEGE